MTLSVINDFYNKKETGVFITGATGFVGLVLIEKLLRQFPSAKLYLLIRPKYKKETAERLEQLKKNTVFSGLLEEKGDKVFQNVFAVAGDVGEDDLGLNDEDKSLLVNNVNLVFHCAATLDFDTDFSTNVNINLMGTKRVIQLCAQLKKCNGLMHVSSAYVNSDRSEVNEVLYSPPDDTEKVIELSRSLSVEEMEVITKKVIKNHPNSYTFTKNLAEHEIAKANTLFPTAIVRPSMILGAWKEPSPGWTASKNGPQGFIMGASKGVVRRLPLRSDLVYDYIPVDVVINHMIVALWNASINWNRSSTVPVYHVTTSTCNPFRWDLVKEDIPKYFRELPIKGAVWTPNLKFMPTLRRFRIAAFIFHMIPAFFLDTLTRVLGGKPVLVRIHTKVNRSLGQLATFIFSEWKFYNVNAINLYNRLNEVDKKIYYMDMREVDWKVFFKNMVLGVRLHLNNEKLGTLKTAIIKNRIFIVLNWLLEFGILYLIWSLTSLFVCPWISASFVVLLAVFTYVYL